MISGLDFTEIGSNLMTNFAPGIDRSATRFRLD